jgi:hypothetical protein
VDFGFGPHRPNALFPKYGASVTAIHSVWHSIPASGKLWEHDCYILGPAGTACHASGMIAFQRECARLKRDCAQRRRGSLFCRPTKVEAVVEQERTR